MEPGIYCLESCFDSIAGQITPLFYLIGQDLWAIPLFYRLFDSLANVVT